MKSIEYFLEFYLNAADDDQYYNDCIDYLVHLADKRGIEFDGYLRQKWIDSADTIYNFDEDYFDDIQRKKLYVYLSCLVDDIIFKCHNEVYRLIRKDAPNKDEISAMYKSLIEKGVKF